MTDNRKLLDDQIDLSKFTGLWIPKEIWDDKRLSLIEKCFLSFIKSLEDNPKKACFASNQYFSKFFNMNTVNVSRHLSKLKKLGYISQQSYDGRLRMIKTRLIENDKTDLSKTIRQTYRKRYDRLIENDTLYNKEYNKEYNKDKNINDFKKSSLNLLDPTDRVYQWIKPIFNILLLLKNEAKLGLNIYQDKSPSKTAQQCINFLQALKDGKMNQYKFDDKWLDDFGVILPKKKYESWGEVRQLILKAIENYNNDLKENNAHKYKSLLTFLYNPESKKSALLKYLSNNIMSSEDIKIQTQIKNLNNPDIEKILKDILYESDKNFNAKDILHFYSNMNNLKNFYNKNRDSLLLYNKAYHDNGFGFYCKDITGFFMLIKEYLVNEFKRFPAWPIPVKDPASRLWGMFRAWLRNTYNVELVMEENKLKTAGKVIEQRNKNDEEKEILEEIKKLEKHCEIEGIEKPSFERLKEMAIKNIKEK
jgi:DNA-binding transcriptional ArsR family regulator